VQSVAVMVAMELLEEVVVLVVVLVSNFLVDQEQVGKVMLEEIQFLELQAPILLVVVEGLVLLAQAQMP
jgi:hypothetical protein